MISDVTPRIEAEEDSLLSLGLGLGIKVPGYLTEKGRWRIHSAVPGIKVSEGP